MRDRTDGTRTRSRRGNYTIFFSLMVPVTFGFAALAVDLSYVRMSEQQLQHTADAASHAAYVVFRATRDTDAATAAAAEIVRRNQVGDGHATLEGVDYGEWDDGGLDTSSTRINAARARLARSGDNALNLFFAPLFEADTHEIAGDSVTAGRTREIMIVQDITGSFADDIEEARKADLAFLDYMTRNQLPGDRLGMTTFVGGVAPEPWTPLSYLETDAVELLDQWSTLSSCNCAYRWCNDNYYHGEDHAPWMQDCVRYGSNTAPGPGVEQAIDELLTYGDPHAFQAIVLVSDGLPCCGNLQNPRSQATVDAVDRAWANGIHVWSVAFNEGGGDFRFLQSLVRGQGVAYETPDASQLEDIMLEIAASIPVVLVE